MIGKAPLMVHGLPAKGIRHRPIKITTEESILTHKSVKSRTLLAATLGLLAAGEAGAQVQVYGVIGAFVGSVKRSGERTAIEQIGPGGLTTSFIGFKGEENLGNGLKAVFALESFFRPDTGDQGRSAADPLFSRNSWVGVESSVGRVTLGRQTNPTYGVMSQLSPFGGSVVFSPLTVQSFVAAYGRNIAGDSVWNNVVKYTTPDLKGFQGSALYGLGEVPGHPAQSNRGLHGTYKNGNFFGAVSVQRVNINVNTPLLKPQNAWLVGATYDFGPVKLYGNVAHTSISGGNSTRLVDAGMSLPVSTSGTILLEAAQSRISIPSATDTRRSTASLGYDHRLSKRTDAYAIYSSDKLSTASSAGTFAVGIRHAF